jgi:23S rRNA pseudouridine1911/1915/1917 synthase
MTENKTKDFPILYEDNVCAVINKPAGVLVHDLPGHHTATAIAAWWIDRQGTTKDDWPVVGREGIVHRLDRDTTGALLLAKTPQALVNLQKQFHDRTTSKVYLALVYGRPDKNEGQIESLVTRNPKNRVTRKSSLIDFTNTSTAKKAISQYKISAVATFQQQAVSLVEFKILTGRTHQIRLHAKMINCPILGDNNYGIKPSKKLSQSLNVKRQMLHAFRLSFNSPANNKRVEITAPLPNDITQLFNKLGIKYAK